MFTIFASLRARRLMQYLNHRIHKDTPLGDARPRTEEFSVISEENSPSGQPLVVTAT
jgi:hypothetical protein